MSRPLRIQVITVGREILTGRTLDTNAHWLCRRIYALGGRVERIAVVDDTQEAIRAELQWALDRGISLLITSGGLGPTWDDRTLEAVAHLFERPLEPDPEALAFLERRYRDFFAAGAVDSPDLTPERRKMALLPRGAQMLPNGVGAAPGVWLEERRGTVVCLPGVPAELRTIFDEHVEKRIRERLGARYRMERIVPTLLGDESVLGRLVERAMKRAPGVYMKTLPERFGEEVRIRVRLEAAGADPVEVDGRLHRAEEALGEEIERWRRQREL